MRALKAVNRTGTGYSPIKHARVAKSSERGWGIPLCEVHKICGSLEEGYLAGLQTFCMENFLREKDHDETSDRHWGEHTLQKVVL